MGETVTMAVGGLMPFGAVFVEFFIILNSIWLDRYYYVFGFLFVVFVVLVVTCAEVRDVLCLDWTGLCLGCVWVVFGLCLFVFVLHPS